MPTSDPTVRPSELSARPGPPTQHELALMIWLCVFPTHVLCRGCSPSWV